MGLDVVLQDEDGNEIDSVSDPTNVLHKVLPTIEDRSFELIRFIDWGADTTFNHLQLAVFLSDWDKLMISKNLTASERTLLQAIRDLASKALLGVEYHVYLKFVGD